MPTPDSAVKNKKAARGRPKAAKVTKTNAPACRISTRSTKTRQSAATARKDKRTALAETTNHQNANITEEASGVDQDGDVVMGGAGSKDESEPSVDSVKEKKPKATKKPASSRGRPKVLAKQHIPIETVEPSPEKIIMETQISEVQAEIEEYRDDEVEGTPLRPMRTASRPRSLSRQPQPPSLHHRRAGSVSDTERSNPSLRRKLGETIKKYENLTVKYQDLREIGLKEAERNFERLKKQCEEKTKASNDFIAKLKSDIATQTALVKDARELKKKVESQASEIAKLQAQIVQMATSLSETQSENKILSTKLAANRTVAASVESANTKVPGSSMKANGGIRMMGTAEAAQVAQAALLKEDLYSDLTGLIIRNVKRNADEDIFDCIQTGRNGTLHFKLAIANEKSADSYEDTQCVYNPQLNSSRDEALIELMPDYLVDDITFPRPQAAKFYARVMKALTEKLS
ncbi:hypothetical protein B7494_g1634 [Chlorociboria aeruginascens]|nr:hypothetical protein B7494_g1634 [Chlorociboria aeruginascens]